MNKDDKLMDHDYDGIHELDNELPRWWLYLFYFTIIWAVAYLLYYHVFGIGYSSADEYKKEMNPAYVRQQPAETRFLGLFPEYRSPIFKEGDVAAGLTTPGSATPYVEETAAADTTVYTAVTDPQQLAEGKEIFLKNCSQCHGRLAEGNIGPNLTDDYWIHGGTFPDIVKTIKYGFVSKGMIAWRGTLKPDQIIQVASYIESIHGSNPPNAKAPQGELVTP